MQYCAKLKEDKCKQQILKVTKKPRKTGLNSSIVVFEK